MIGEYDFKKVEKESQDVWQQGQVFSFDATSEKEPFSMFMMPPNASGPMHVGNSLMIALQDILARYYKSKGHNVLWVPGLDHGGYETQVTYERKLEKQGVKSTREEFDSKQLFEQIKQFVDEHKNEITSQIMSLGASMDMSLMQYTMSDSCVEYTHDMFRKMVEDKVIVRSNYMMNYCPDCATVLADIEIKKTQVEGSSYLVKLSSVDGSKYIEVETTQPEMLFSMTEVLVHPQDKRYHQHIGSEFINPLTGEIIFVVSSNRPLNWHQQKNNLIAFYPSFERYDYEYAVRNNLSVTNQLDWEGKLLNFYPGKTLPEVGILTLEKLKSMNVIASSSAAELESRTCKKGHNTVSLIRLAWFLQLDNERKPLRAEAVAAFDKENPTIYPKWRKKGVLDWIKKMPDWPISRQNVWGIKLPVWYEVTNPSDFLVWFFDKNGNRRYGNLQDFLNEGFEFQEIVFGLQRVYAETSCMWVTNREHGKLYLPETDTLDTWFSSTIWGVFIYKELTDSKFADFYPSENIILGHDLLRLFIARKALLGVYLTEKLPFNNVFFHPLVLGEDGQKMSKSLGNSITLNEYIKNYGADTTRFALVSRLDSTDDFAFGSKHLNEASGFMKRLCKMSQAYSVIVDHGVSEQDVKRLDSLDFEVVKKFSYMSRSVGKNIEKYQFQKAQFEAASFLSEFENLTEAVIQSGSLSSAVAFLQLYKKYLIVLHPFIPHVTESIFQSINNSQSNSTLYSQKWV